MDGPERIDGTEEPESKKMKLYRSWMRLKKPIAPKSTFYRNSKLHDEPLQTVSKTKPSKETVAIAPRAEASCITRGPPSPPAPTLNDADGDTSDNESNSSVDCGSYSPGSSNDSFSSSEEGTLNDSDSHHSSISGSLSENWNSGSFEEIRDLQAENPTTEEQPVSSDEGHSNNCENMSSDTLKIPEKVPHLDCSMTDQINCTKFEALLMILNFSFRHGLSGLATEDLCELVNCIVGFNCIPTSAYWMKKVFGSVKYAIHFYCSKCECYIGEVPNDKPRRGVLVCPLPTCKNTCNVQNLNDGHFFVTLSLKEQLKFLLETTENVVELLNHRWTRTSDPEQISDIYDGSVYTNLSRDGNILSQRFNLSGTVNTDGAVVFHSLKNTLYPIHFRINEFPPNIRFNQCNSLLGGLYFGKKEPNMSLFLAQFVKEMNDLYENGVVWSPSPGQQIVSKVVLIQCVAKAKVQNINQFNGYYGCGYCLHPGVVCDDVVSNQAKYIMNDDLHMYDDLSLSYTVTKEVGKQKELKTFHVEDRTDSAMREDMEEAERIRQASQRTRDDHINVNGMKGICAFNFLLFFDLVFGFAIDYLHCVLLGVCRTLTGLWLDHKGPFYIGDENVANIEARLKSIAPPSSISRRPRPLSERIHWKGNEWRAWLLYYSLPCLVGSLPTKYLKHYCFLASASYILLGDSVSRDDVNKAAWYLVQFVVSYGKLYGDHNMFYNVHLLLHLGKMVNLYGPWWCYSAFSFESANGSLIKLVKGTRGVASQISEKYSMCKLVPHVLDHYKLSKRVMEFCEDLLCYRTAKLSTKVGSVTVLGSQRFVILTEEEKACFAQAGIQPSNYSFERFVKNAVMYHAQCYSRRGEKSDDTVVKLQSGTYGIILRILVLNKNNDQPSSIKVLLKMLNVASNQSIVNNTQVELDHIKCCYPIVYGRITFEDVEEVLSKAILLKCGDDAYITDFRNTHEKD